MSQRVFDIQEMLGGIYDALDGREPNEAIQKKIDELEADLKDAETSSWHGWECYCATCCE